MIHSQCDQVFLPQFGSDRLAHFNEQHIDELAVSLRLSLRTVIRKCQMVLIRQRESSPSEFRYARIKSNCGLKVTAPKDVSQTELSV